MGAALGGDGEVAIVSFMPGSAATIEREQAFQDELRLLFPRIRVVAMQYGMADRTRAERITGELLASHPNLSGIFADNESSSIGALRALQKQSRPKLKLIAFDSSDELVGGLRSGLIDALVVQDPYRMGYETIRVLAAKLAGKHPPVYVDSGIRLVRAGDLDDREVKRLLSTTPEQQAGHAPR
jgi:ribose transport system substrate-binding protein